MRIGMIGLGAIGQGVITLLNGHPSAEIEVVAVMVRDPQRERLCQTCNLVSTLDDLLATNPEVVLEVGGHLALSKFGPDVLRHGCDLLMTSIGALANPDVEYAIKTAAQSGKGRAQVISGAIGGLDALAAAAVGGLTSVIVTTRKPAATLISDHDETIDSSAREIFAGTAREAALTFPESVNVAAAVSLAGIGFDRTEVHVIADPAINLNRHEIVAEGLFGTLRIEICNVPTAMNPKSASLVAMSAVHALTQRRSLLRVG